MAVLHPTGKEFEEIVGSEKLVMADFFASWCGPCKMIAPIIEELAQEYEGKATILKLDVDENQEIAAKFNVMSIPTILFFKDGQLESATPGARPKSFYSQKLDELL